MDKYFSKDSEGESLSKFLANSLYRYANQSLGLPHPPEAFTVARDNCSFLELPAFRQWLSEFQLPTGKYTAFSRYVAAWAILQPKEAAEILDATLERFPELHATLVGVDVEASKSTPPIATAVSPTPSTPPSVVDRQDVGDPALPERDMDEAPGGSPHSGEVLRETYIMGDAGVTEKAAGPRGTSALGTGTERALLALEGSLERQLNDCRAALSRLREARSRCRELIGALGEYPPARASEKLLRTSDEPLDKILRTLKDLELDLQGIHRADLRLREYSARLGIVFKPPQFADHESLRRSIDAIEREAEALGAELALIGAHEERVTEFLGTLSATPLGSWGGLIEKAPVENLDSLAHFFSYIRVLGRKEDVIRVEVALPDLVAALVCQVWEQDSHAGTRLVKALITTPRWGADLISRLGCMSFLRLRDLTTLAKQARECAEAVGLLLLGSGLRLVALSRTDSALEAMEHLGAIADEGLITKPCSSFYRAVLAEWRRTGPSIPATDGKARERRLLGTMTKAQNGLLAFVESEAGYSGHYHHLCEYARRQYLMRLVVPIRAQEAKDASRILAGWGGVDGVLKYAVSSLPPKEVHDRHVEKARQYLAEFNSLLVAWEATVQEVASFKRTALEGAFEDVVASSVASAASPSAILLSILSGARAGAPNMCGRALDPVWAGLREDGLLDLQHPACSALLSPTRLETWLAYEDGVPLTSVIADLLKEALGLGWASTEAALNEMLSRKAFRAARRVVAASPEYAESVAASIAGERSKIESEASGICERLEKIAPESPEARDALALFTGLLNEYQFEQARESLPLMEDVCATSERSRSPVRLALLEFLDSAGVSHDRNAPEDQLRALIERVKEANSERRRHINVLRVAARRTAIPEVVRGQWSAAAETLDRPSAWPGAEMSALFEVALEQVLRYIEGRWRSRGGTPGLERAVAEVGQWTIKALKSALGSSDPEASEAFKNLSSLEQAISGYAADARILEIIGAMPGAQTTGEIDPVNVPSPVSQTGNVKEGARLEQRAGIAWIRTRVEMVRLGTRGREPGGHEGIRQFALRREWGAVRRTAAGVADSVVADASPEDRLIDHEAMLLLGAVLSADEAGGHDQDDCDAALAAVTTCSPTYYLPAKELWRAVCLLFCATVDERLGEGLSDEEVADALCSVLRKSAEAPRASQQFRRFSRAMWRSSSIAGPRGKPGSATLAEILWDTLKPGVASKRARADLLQSLFAAGRRESLDRLAEKAETLKDMIRSGVRLFERLGSDSSIRPQALQLAAVLRTHGKGKPNLGPWNEMFHRLEGADTPVAGPSLQVQLLSQECTVLGDDEILVELRLEPGTHSWPDKLDVFLGEESLGDGILPQEVVVLEEGDPLLSPREVELAVRVPRELGRRDEIRIPYRFEGTTFRGEKVVLPGAWSLTRNPGSGDPLSPTEVQTAWPGVTGKPVEPTRGFHGRKKEIDRIDASLQANRSMMVFGERRIGKTSLLLEIVASHPPTRGKTACVYVDVSGMELPSDVGGMRKALFDRILDFMVTFPANEPVRHAIEVEKDRHPKLGRFRKDLRPETSLMTALEGLVSRLDAESGGEVGRVAFLLDEFDRFVAAWYSAAKQSVQTLMWDLRQIVQLSKRVSIVLAGSGLQRVFVETPEDALYNSIDTITLFPFSVADDREAIADTFLPGSLRQRLIGTRSREEVIDLAAHLCGGHPYFLSMFGAATAFRSKGRIVTPPLMKRVVEVMTTEEAVSLPFGIVPDKFYGHFLEALITVDARKRGLAKILLANIAQHTTVDYDEVSITEAMACPQVPSDIGEYERYGALQALEAARIVTFRPGVVKMPVPLTAAAVRHHALRILQEGVRELGNG